MNILIVCSGNVPLKQLFNMKLQHPFIFEQVVEIEKLGVSFDFYYITEKGIKGYLKSILQLRKKIRFEEYDLVHAHYGLSGVVASFQRKLPLVVTFHGCDVNRKDLNILSSIVALFSKANIFVTSNLQNKILIKTIKKNYMIPCGVDLEQFYPMNKFDARKILKLDAFKEYILFSSGKENLVKNYSLARSAVDQFPDVELLEISKRTREEVNLLMNACDLFLMTSIREGSPQTIKEAMACNCPIVSTEVGDVGLVTANTPGCFICGFKSSDVAEKIQLALEFVKSEGRTIGRQRITEIGIDSKEVARKIVVVYQKILKNKV